MKSKDYYVIMRVFHVRTSEQISFEEIALRFGITRETARRYFIKAKKLLIEEAGGIS